jgi:chromosome segregation ATPase
LSDLSIEVKPGEKLETLEPDKAITQTNQNKSGNPLSVRIDPYFKEKFEALTKELGLSKKMLFENLILSYLRKDEQNQREANLNLTNEINLIATNLEELLTIFSKMAAKSQDTIGSLKSDHAQQLTNLETKNHTLTNKVTELTEKSQLLETANQGYNSSKKQLEQTIAELEQKILSNNEAVQKENYKNLELLEQLNQLRHVERENLFLKTEATKSTQEIKTFQDRLDETQAEVLQLRKKIANLKEEQADWKTKQTAALQEQETRIRREARLDQKTALLQLQTEYNKLQTENLHCLGKLNQKAAELAELKLQLRESGSNAIPTTGN